MEKWKNTCLINIVHNNYGAFVAFIRQILEAFLVNTNSL